MVFVKSLLSVLTVLTALAGSRTALHDVRRWLVLEGLAAALERKKQAYPSHPPKLDGKGQARLTALACSQPPEGRHRWTLQLLADRLVELQVVDSISDQTVRRTLKKTSYRRTGRSAG